MREEAHNYLTLALIYREAGLYEDGWPFWRPASGKPLGFLL